MKALIISYGDYYQAVDLHDCTIPGVCTFVTTMKKKLNWFYNVVCMASHVKTSGHFWSGKSEI